MGEVVLTFMGTSVTAIATIVCAIIAYRSEQRAKITKEEKERSEKRANRRLQESRLSLELMNANCALSVGTALAVKRGHANGELEEGLQQVELARKKYLDFLKAVAVEDIIGGDD